MTCDVCGASDPPRNPTWRSNTEKVCDPCWYRLQAAIRERIEALLAASPSVTEPLDPFEDWSEVLTSDDAYEGGQADD